MQQPDSVNNLEFEKAQEKDADLLFNWVNDSEVRAQSLTSHVINYSEHLNWFSKKLTDKYCYLYIVYRNSEPVGMIRFDVHEDECTISYLVNNLHRGKGIGSSIVKYGIKQFQKDSSFKGLINATVKTFNVPSLKIFERLGFDKKNEAVDIILFKKII